jgi:hypothetical protein
VLSFPRHHATSSGQTFLLTCDTTKLAPAPPAEVPQVPMSLHPGASSLLLVQALSWAVMLFFSVWRACCSVTVSGETCAAPDLYLSLYYGPGGLQVTGAEAANLTQRRSAEHVECQHMLRPPELAA